MLKIQKKWTGWTVDDVKESFRMQNADLFSRVRVHGSFMPRNDLSKFPGLEISSEPIMRDRPVPSWLGTWWACVDTTHSNHEPANDSIREPGVLGVYIYSTYGMEEKRDKHH